MSRRSMSIRCALWATLIGVAFCGARVFCASEPRADFQTVSNPAAANPAAAATDAARPTSWEHSPYRILVYVQFDPGAEWTTPRRASLLAEIEARSRALIGGLWQIKAINAPAELHCGSAADIARVSTDAVANSALELDKVMLLGLESTGDGLRRFHVREFDVRTQVWGATTTIVPRDGIDLAREMVRGLWESFSPIVRIEELSEQGVVAARVRGGALPLAARSLELMHPGTLLRPLIRHFDAQGRTVKGGIFPVAWTLLVVDQVDGPTAKCQIVTGVQDPLDLRYDGRTEYLGLAITTRAAPSTELIIRARGAGARPLEDLEIFAERPGQKTLRLIGRTDEHGVVKIESPAKELEMMLVRSGDEPLAKFPLVPGLEPTVVVQVEDNGRRLETGNLVAQLDEELIDLVAQQTVLVARLQRAMARQTLDEAEKTLSTLKHLKTAEAFLKSIDERGTALASITSEAAAADWFDKRLEEIKSLATKHLLDAKGVARLEGGLAAMRSP